MPYDKTLIDESGEQFPYSESLDSGTYYYRISVVWDERDGELQVMQEGAHIEFDDDGSWLAFDVAPEILFPEQDGLSEGDLLSLLGFLASREQHARTVSAGELEAAYQVFLKQKRDREDL